uniref:Cysteinyl-tRNA ligase anticodon binding domain-containing protein n=1 Tax=Phaeocystis antarctica TaxID=33657 RepID=A0A7S0DUT6_9EUKA
MAAPESTPKTEMKLTPTLIEWGVDAELWGATRNKQALLDLADAGDEAKARERITFLKKAVQGGHTKANDRPYAVTGVVPTGVDVAVVEAKLAQRVELKRDRDFDGADVIQAELLAMGIWINDKQRIWSASNTVYTLKGEVPAGVDVAAVEDMLARRMNEKKTGDFDAADAIQAELNGMGVFVNDRKKTWEASK